MYERGTRTSKQKYINHNYSSTLAYFLYIPFQSFWNMSFYALRFYIHYFYCMCHFIKFLFLLFPQKSSGL